jgi:hypothetical protein
MSDGDVLRSDKNLGGRPLIDLDVDQIGRLATIGCTDEEIAAVMNISHDTLSRRRKSDPHLAEVIEHARGLGKTTLRRLQWQQANAGNPTMLIWLGKQMLGQKDRHEHTGEGGGPIELIITGVRRALEQDDVPTINHEAAD